MTTRSFKWLIASLTTVVFLLDSVCPAEWSASRFYLPCILLTYRINERATPFWLATISTVLTLIGFAFVPSGVPWSAVVLSRITDILLFWIVAAFVVQMNRSFEDRRRLEAAVEQKRIELQTERTLRASESRYRTFVDHASDALFVHGQDGIVIDVNRQACESLGYSKEELIGQFPPHFAERLAPEFLEDIVQRLNTGEKVSFEAFHRRRDGTSFPVEVRICPFIVDGKRFGLSIARDHTERKRAEDELRASERRFRDLADAIPQIIWTATPDGHLDHLNSRVSEFTGIDANELKGQLWEKIVHPDDLSSTIEIWTEVLRSGIPRDKEFRLLYRYRRSKTNRNGSARKRAAIRSVYATFVGHCLDQRFAGPLYIRQ